MVAVAADEVKMVKDREHGSGHRPHRRHRNIPPISELNRPVQKRIGYYEISRRVEPVEQQLERLTHLSLGSSHEAGHVGGAVHLRRQDVGDRGEAYTRRLLLGADEAEPLLRDHDGYEEVGLGID